MKNQLKFIRTAIDVEPAGALGYSIKLDAGGIMDAYDQVQEWLTRAVEEAGYEPDNRSVRLVAHSIVRAFVYNFPTDDLPLSDEYGRPRAFDIDGFLHERLAEETINWFKGNSAADLEYLAKRAAAKAA